jgi:hypothetical protein
MPRQVTPPPDGRRQNVCGDCRDAGVVEHVPHLGPARPQCRFPAEPAPAIEDERGRRSRAHNNGERPRETMRWRDWNLAAATLAGLGAHPSTTLRRCVPTIGMEEGKLLSEVLRERLPPDMADQQEQFDHPTKTVATPANLNAEANKGRDIRGGTLDVRSRRIPASGPRGSERRHVFPT